MIEIYWDDLTKEKQEEIIRLCGDNCNFDVFPIAEISEPGDESFDIVNEQSELKEEVKYEVYIKAGSVKKVLTVFDKEEDAEQFCETNNYEYFDENDFCWDMGYEEKDSIKTQIKEMEDVIAAEVIERYQFIKSIGNENAYTDSWLENIESMIADLEDLKSKLFKESSINNLEVIIYQSKELSFLDYEWCLNHNLSINIDKYDEVYTYTIDNVEIINNLVHETLEDIYKKFNIDRPEDFKGHSLSVGDVVVLCNGEEKNVYFVDRIGFREIADFFDNKNLSLDSQIKDADNYKEKNTRKVDSIVPDKER